MTQEKFAQRLLYTKDGCVIGNAILIRKYSEKEIKDIATSLFAYLTNTNQELFLVETDFGNRMKLSTNEIDDMFVYGRETTLREWSIARARILDEQED